MARVRACAQWICVLALACCWMGSSQAEEIRDYYSEPGLNPFKDTLNQSLNEHIDPFSGTLQLKYTDITVPGNGGMDINVNRVYVSLQDYPLPLLGINGVGWVMHFGRIVTPQRHAGKICGQAAYAESAGDNPALELPDGGRELLVLNSIEDDGSLITRSNWRGHCVAGQAGMVVTSPDGTKYTMNHATFLQGEPSWMTTRIEDVHGNWIRIDYQVNPAGISYITEIYRSEEGSSQAVVTYEYEDQGTAGIKLSAITANGQRWQYFYEPITGYTYGDYQHLVAVQRPDGRRWQYAYNPEAKDPNPDDNIRELTPGGHSLRQMVYPHGATIDYTYQFVRFDPGSHLQTTAVQSKTVTGSGVTNGEWQFAFAPHSRPYVGSEGHTLRYDVTTVTAPDAIYRYVHFGKDFAGLPNGTQVSIRPRFVGLLAFKETYSRAEELLENRGYVWSTRLISEEDFWHGAGYRHWWTEDGTYAPILMGEGYNRDSAAGNTTTYQHVKLYFDHDAYGNPGGVYEMANLSGQLSRQTRITYQNDVSRWILGRPLTETIAAVQAAQDDGTTIGEIIRTYYDHGKVRTEDRFGVVTEFTYTSEGDLASVEDARGKVRRYSNYRRGIAQREELPESVVILRDVNATGTLKSQTNGRGFTTSYTYDDLNRLTGIDYPVKADVTISYDQQSGASSRVLTRHQYRQTELINDFGQTTRTERHDRQSGETIYKTMSFDSLGRQTFISYPNSSIGLTTSYDALGRITRTEHPDSSAVEYSYNDVSVDVLNERNMLSEYLYLMFGVDDSSQAPYRIVQNSNVATIVDRDVMGNTTRVIQGSLAGGNITGFWKTYRYDSRQFLTHATETEVGTTVYTHDAVGNVVTESVNSAAATEFVWDDLGRRVGVNFADETPDVVTVYDRNNNVVELQKGVTRWNYVYDENGNLSSETLSVRDPWFGQRSYQLTYAHDSTDVVESLTYPSGLVVQYAPDAFGRATRVGTFATDVRYHPSGQLSGYTLGNGVATTVELNQRLMTRRIQSGTVLDLTYGYDAAGNVSSITDAVVPTDSVTSLGYDGLERLTSARGRWGERFFTYDSNGNFSTRVTGTAVKRYTIDGRARLSEISSGDVERPANISDTTQFDYDLRGNMTSKRFYHLYASRGTQGIFRSVDTRLRFDSASNLVSAEVRDSNQQENPALRAYAYDGNGMRYSERDGKNHALRLSVYGSANVLLFEDAFGECNRTDHIVLGALNIAKSSDAFASATLDSDGDGLVNCIEVQLGLNPQNASDAAGDLDNDGLSNLAEFNAGSSPLFADTDGDGLGDAREVQQHGTDPFAADGDGDGIADADEILDPRLNPKLADSDHDGVNDHWEVRLGSDPSNPLDATEDFDADGFSNRQESWTHLDPLNRGLAPNRGTPGIRHDIGGPVDWRPAIGRDGALYVPNAPTASNSDYVVAVNADGSSRWNMLETGAIVGPMTVGSDGTVYYWTRPPAPLATDPESILYARNPDGSERWSSESISFSYQSAIALGPDGQVVVGGSRGSLSDGFVTMFDRDGNALISQTFAGAVERSPIVAPDGTIFVVSNIGVVHAIDPDGSTQWTYALRAGPLVDMSLGPNGTLFVTNGVGYTTALRRDGTLLWEQRHASLGSRSSVVVGDNDTLYLGTAAGQLLAIRASDGGTIWNASVSGTAVLTPAVARNGTIYAVTTGGTVAAFDQTGASIWSRVVGSVVSAAPTLDRDGTLYVGTLRGQVWSFVDNSGGVARSVWPMQQHDSASTSSICFNSETFGTATDTDGDRMQDCDEIWLGLDPNSAGDGALDFDGDGLSNTEEAQAGTRLDRADTDGDGLSDGLEVRTYRTNPLSTDSDADTLPDGYEVQYRFNPLDPADALVDSDGDGFSNRQEILAGTDPLSLSGAPTTGTIATTIGDSSFPVRQAAVHPNGTLFVNGPNRLEARAPSLSLLWTWPESVEGHIAIGTNGIVYAVTRPANGAPRVVALFPDGTPWWSHPIADTSAFGFDGPVIGNDGSVYVSYRFRGGSARVQSYSSTGEPKNSRWLDTSFGDVQQRFSVDLRGRLLAASGSLTSYDPNTLQVNWNGAVPAGAMSVPVVDTNGAVYVGKDDGLYAVSATDGVLLWENHVVRGQPVLTEDGLIVARCRDNRRLCALDRNGALQWEMSTSYTLLGAPAVDSANVIHQVTGNGTYLRISSAGAQIGAANIPTLTAFEYPAFQSDGMVYLGAPGANILAFNNATGTVSSNWPAKNRDMANRRNAAGAPIGPLPSGPSLAWRQAPPSFIYFRSDQPVRAAAYDYADGDISSAIRWHSSVDGAVGQGAILNLGVLSAGTHTVTASIQDSAGNRASARFTVAVENQAPALTLISPPEGGAQVEIGEPVRLRASAIDVVDGDISAQIVWTSDDDLGTGGDLTVTLSPGVHYVQAYVTNSLGLSSYKSAQVRVEYRAPTVTIIEPSSSNTVTQGAVVEFSGTAVDVRDGDLSARLRWVSTLDGPLHVGAGFSTSALSVGNHYLYAEAIDSDNALGEDFVLLEVRSVSPNSPPDVDAYPNNWNPIVYGQSIRFNASAWDSEDGTLTNVRWYSNRDGQLGTGLQFTTRTLSVGVHRIQATATDSQGAKGGRSFNVTVVPPSLLQGSSARGGRDLSLNGAPVGPEPPPRKPDWFVRFANERQGVRPTFVQTSFIGAVL
jgi:YD repeat-containing protein